ncbi:MAG: hypothetical protein ACLTEE_13660 [Anaerobutyricum hallii]
MASGIAAITVKNGVNYDAPDGRDVKTLFLLLPLPKTFYWSVSWPVWYSHHSKETATRKREEKKGKH